MFWIPSHVGHLGNEVADRMARLGTGTNTYGPAPIIPVPQAAKITKNQISIWIAGKHQKYWEDIPKHRQSKMTMPKVSIKIWKTIQNMTRQQVRICTHMLTGHNVLEYHLSNMEKTNSPHCKQCGERKPETAHHFIGECPKFSNIRYSMFRQHLIEENQMKDLNIHKILAFVRKTKRYIES